MDVISSLLFSITEFKYQQVELKIIKVDAKEKIFWNFKQYSD